MKRREFISLTVASGAVIAATGCRESPPAAAATSAPAPPAAAPQDAPKLTIAFVGGSFFVKTGNNYLVVQPNGHRTGVRHRAFIVGPREPTIPGLTPIRLPDRYPLTVMHPALRTAGEHTVYCLDKTDIEVGDRAQTTVMGDSGLARFQNNRGAGTNPKDDWHNFDGNPSDHLNGRFLLGGGTISKGAAVNTEGAGKVWAFEGQDGGPALSDVTEFVSTSPTLKLKNGAALQVSGPVKFYVFGGPTEKEGHKPPPEYSEITHHDGLLKSLYRTPSNNNLKLKADTPVRVPYVLQITHPCGVSEAGIRGFRMIPPDTEFCVSGEGDPP